MEERTGIVTMKGDPLTLVGDELKVGDPAPDCELLDNELSPVKLSSFRGKVCIISSVPSLDTPVCDVETRRFKFARAGHDPVVLFNERRTPPLQVLDSKGMALGMDAGPIFEQTIEELEIQLQAADIVLQYTDGVTEAMNEASEQFGHERLYEVLEAHGRHEVEYVMWKIEKALEAFRGGQPRTDDLTMVGFKVQG